LEISENRATIRRSFLNQGEIHMAYVGHARRLLAACITIVLYGLVYVARVVYDAVFEPVFIEIRNRWRLALGTLNPPVELVSQRRIKFGQVEFSPLGVGGGHPARC
jgi:hypothetical protein